MIMTPNETAALLIQALPYIRRYVGKTMVVKVGGLPMTDPERARSLAKDVLLLHSVGIRPVLVHGGGPQIDAQMKRAGLVPEFRDGLRVTDAETLDIVRMVLVGKINRELVSAVNVLEPVAVGVAGEDGRLLEVEQADPALGFVGRVTNVRAGLLHALLDDGLIPIVSTVGADARGQAYNVNADDAARAIAVAMGAEKILYLTGTPGLLADPGDPSSLIAELTADEARRAIADASVTGGMIPKLVACAEAVEGGVGSAVMLDGRAEHSLLIELFTDQGIGTMVCAADKRPLGVCAADKRPLGVCAADRKR
jgi:acetylglutamate kinase